MPAKKSFRWLATQRLCREEPNGGEPSLRYGDAAGISFVDF
jgi:hypothetical protein